ncbi:MAG: hypothetical protein HQ582_03085 [Planctomycetes bacterium]|nr:hypothetical protein [Planctomycetota bacterium]
MAAFFVPPAALAQQPGLETPPGEGCVLLQNGNLLQGRITPTEGGYLVAIDGGRIVVRAEEVEFCCGTLEEAYQRKRSFLQPGDVRAHLELAQWSQRHGLPGHAARELAEVKALAPAHPMIPLIQRRIQMSLFPPEKIQRPVRQIDNAPSFEDLERLVRGMPPRSMETFTQAVQPLLMNHCSTAGCHGPEAENRFRLFRTPAGRHPSRRLTQRNLHSTLEWIDRSDPGASKLLLAPVRPHGSAQDAIFAEQQVDQYKQIVDWVYYVASQNEPVDTVSHQQPTGESARQADALHTAAPAVHTAPVDPSDDGFLGGHLKLYPNAAAPGSSQPALTEAGKPSPLPNPLLQPNTNRPKATSSTYEPVDPFDAEVFNRRFLPGARGR